MIRGIYATSTGMIATQTAMDTIANNLANLSTTGFKRDGVSFGESFERELYSNAGLGDSLGTLGSGAVEKQRFTVFEMGAINDTSNPLDVAIKTSQGAFAVQVDPQTVQYTRAGDFSLDENRQLVTKEGKPVLDDTLQPITLPNGIVEISQDGNISVDGNSVAKLGVFDGTFTKVGNNLMSSNDATPIEITSVEQSALEGSNVNATETMVKLITLNRLYELSQKSIQQQDSMTQRLIQSLSEK
jgi:flagellar basal body rod protein FlgG